MSAKVEVRDLGIGRLHRELAKLGELRLLVGVIGERAKAKHPNADASVGQVGAWMEFGTPGSDDRTYDQIRSLIPSRPFVRHGMEPFRKGNRMMKDAVSSLIDGRTTTADKAWNEVGKAAVESVQASLVDAGMWAQPLAESTVKAKGWSDPLIGPSSALFDAIAYSVRDKSGREVAGGR
jgi:hypothetical protein